MQLSVTNPIKPISIDNSTQLYVQACIEVANWRKGESIQNYLNALNRIYGGAPTFMATDTGELIAGRSFVPKHVESSVDDARETSAAFFVALEGLLSRKPEHRRWIRANAQRALSGVLVDTELHVKQNGDLEHVHQYLPRDVEAATALLTCLLLSPSARQKSDLRQCKYCDRFFLAVSNARGGRRFQYCPGTDHQKLSDARKAPARMAASRARRKRMKNRSGKQ